MEEGHYKKETSFISEGRMILSTEPGGIRPRKQEISPKSSLSFYALQILSLHMKITHEDTFMFLNNTSERNLKGFIQRTKADTFEGAFLRKVFGG